MIHGLSFKMCHRRLTPGSKGHRQPVELRAAHQGLIVTAYHTTQLLRSLLVSTDRIIKRHKSKAVARIQCCFENHFGPRR